ncbi:MAG TPA: serine/threonine-protein kinase, partial [Gemmatimonadaceae bacterium]
MQPPTDHTADLPKHLQDSLGTAYVLQRELGGGGMARVFLAKDTSLDRAIVVKVLPPDMASGVSMERFRREIKLAARLAHPHIVPVLSAGEAGGIPYYTMPFVEGDSLRARLTPLSEDGQVGLPISEIVPLLRDVARALAYAHSRGVIHRDIKPGNILVVDGAALVTDFGVAKALVASTAVAEARVASDTATALGVALGTPAYMAPEQVAADPAIDGRADLYA